MRGIDKKDLLIILQILSNMFRMYGIALLIPIIFSIFVHEKTFTEIFLIMAVATIIIASVAKYFLRHTECKTKHAIISLAIAWVAISTVSAIPFMFSGMGYIDAFFEALSGWTGSGFTMVPDPGTLPQTINFFRGFIQWVGGFGIVILALLFYETPKTAQTLFLAEGRFEDFYVDILKIARIIVVIYSVYSFIGIVLLYLSGVPLFDAVVHILTTISTGGFSTNTIGIGSYGNVPMFIGIVFMYIGGISFLSHYALFKGKIKKFFGNPEIRALFAISLICIALVMFDVFLTKQHHYYSSIFYVVSAITGTGAGTTVHVSSFPATSLVIFMLLMVSGAAYGSTSGALKIWRTMIILKVIKREIQKPFLPLNAIIPIKMGNNIISDETALKAASYMILYLNLILIGSIIFMFFGYSAIESVFTVASAQGNVGLNILPAIKYFDMSPILKLLLTAHMLLGRMEIFPLLILLRSFGIAGR